ncbi:non-ribosomal peptide synthetase [Pedobacter xixiisoli]|uniref:Amino acid adenylation domain-containing protein n=1 Tax=Pedobacter xixiisoli TaxID=1476464 RepID=A0A286ACM1_9SPHI|nr:non-ribosomal peptide synthetase [Pedobacter xixiisoli]SOD19617.1 amino acid adenylation domain-containing protein [Pedobacter xixiisoli]
MSTDYLYKSVNHHPFTANEISKVVPSTEAQKEIYVAVQLGDAPASLAYNESITLAFNQPISADKLEKAFHFLIKRHEALRSIISKNGEQVIIFEDIPFQLDKVETSAEEYHQTLKKIALNEVNTVFNLNSGPLFRTTLVENGQENSSLVITGHHIVFDGWSIGVLLQELSAIYTFLSQNEAPILAETTQISDYAKEEFIYRDSDAYQSNKQFWVNQFKEHTAFDFPIDHERPAIKTYDAKRLDFEITQQLSANVKSMGAKAGVSFVSSLLVAFEVLLAKISGNKQIVLGLPTAGQSATSHFNLVGHCVNMLPLKSHIKHDLAFDDYLKTRNQEILEAYEYQRFTFGSLVKELPLQRDQSRTPLIPISFNVDLGYDNGVNFNNNPHQLYSNPRSHEIFEIFLNISGSEKELNVEWSYNTNLFKESTIEKYHQAYVSLLEKLTLAPKTVIRNILKGDYTAPLKENQLNQTSAAYPTNKPLGNFISETAKKYPTRIAVSTTAQKITYAELEQKSNQFAAKLMLEGVEIGQKVGLAVDRSVAMVIALTGILKCGAAYLPFDPTYPAERIKYMLDDGEADYLIISEAYRNQLQTPAKVLTLEQIINSLDELDEHTALPSFNTDELLYILHTSGSTGKPKGVQITHRNVVNLLLSVQDKFGIKPDDKMLSVTTISFDIAEVEIFLPLITGAEVMIASKEEVRDAEQLLNLLDTQNITFMQATPSGWQMLLDAGWEKKHNLTILCGGEPMSHHLAQNLLRRCEALWNVYGPTETTIYSTINQIQADDEIISIGRPLNNTQIYFLDEYLNEVEDGEIGEIYIAGDGVSKGYINKPALTAERYLSNPFTNSSSSDTQSIMYRTGDLGKLLPNGKIQCLGRIDHQIKIRGYRIELEEIEQNLLKQPNIQKAVVAAVELQAGNQQLVAYIIPQNYSAENSYKEEIVQWKAALKDALPAFMVPAFFYTLATFPLTPNGKIDRNTLAKNIKSVTPATPVFVSANTEAEKEILAIWQKVLNKDDISTTDNFFELGGHSLLAVQVMQQIGSKMKVKLPLASLFQYPSIQKLAELATAKREDIQWNSLVKIRPEGSKTPVYFIHGSGLNVLMFYPMIKYMDAEQPVYGLQAQGLDGNLPSFTSIEEVAKMYVDEVIADRPNGPYAFIGYSLGGIIGLEMAKQLQEMGKEVKFFGVVDTYIGNRNFLKSRTTTLVEKVFRQPKKLLFFGGQFLQNPQKTVNYQVNHIKNLGNKIFSPTATAAQVSLEDKINDIYMEAYMRYDLQPYDGIIHLFKVKERIYFVDEPKYLGWKPYAPKGLKITYINGDHATFLTAPNDKSSAEIIQRELDKA